MNAKLITNIDCVESIQIELTPIEYFTMRTALFNMEYNENIDIYGRLMAMEMSEYLSDWRNYNE